MERLILKNQIDSFAREAQKHTDTQGAIKDSRYDVVSRVDVGFAGVQKSICDAVSDVKGSVLPKLDAGFFGVQKSICDSTSDIKGTVVHGTEDTLEALCGVDRSIASAREANLGLAKDAQAVAYQIEGRQALDAAKNNAAILNQGTMYANAAQVQLERVRAELGLQAQTYAAASELAAVKFASAAELRAQQIACEAAKQLAECCCELKEQAAATRSLVSSESASTRALITDNRMHDLERKLADSQSAVRDAKLERLICCGCGDSGRRGGNGQGNGND